MRAVAIPGEIFQRDDLSSDAKLLLGFILPMGRCTMSQPLLALRTGMSVIRVRRAQRSLCERGLVSDTGRKGLTRHLDVLWGS